jgi:hypothetical protein
MNELKGKVRGNQGRFIFNGGKKSCLRDKPCPDCGKLIMRRSTRCRSCSQKGYLHHNYTGKIKTCIRCGKQIFGYKPRYCQECFRDERHFAYKGENAGYVSKHTWVRSRLGKANHCELCGDKNAKKYEWANLSGEYHRDLSDWLQMCKHCHIFYDKYYKFNVQFI